MEVRDATVRVSASRNGIFYKVDLRRNSCTCPHYMHRLRRSRLDCKHIRMAKEHFGSADEFDLAVAKVRESAFMDTTDLQKQFAGLSIRGLIDAGILNEDDSKVWLSQGE